MSEYPASLIVGGLDRGIDWGAYEESFQTHTPRAVIGIPDNGPRIISKLRAAGIRPEAGFHECANLETAVRLAVEITQPGGLVLLSPGAPSFPQFRDYRERGQRFAALCGFSFDGAEDF